MRTRPADPDRWLLIDPAVSYIDHMVNTDGVVRTDDLGRVAKLVAVYVVVAFATVAALAVLSGVDSGEVTQNAWVHAVIVGVFAVLLPVRLRAARGGSRRAMTAVGVVATVLLVVNIVEAVIPGLFPIWMRVEMVGIAVLMAAVAVSILRGR